MKVAALIGEVLPPEDEVDEHGFNVAARPLCPFCSKPWGDRMLELLDLSVTNDGYYPGDQDYTVAMTIDIECDGCERLIYRKEVDRCPG